MRDEIINCDRIKTEAGFLTEARMESERNCFVQVRGGRKEV